MNYNHWFYPVGLSGCQDISLKSRVFHLPWPTMTLGCIEPRDKMERSFKMSQDNLTRRQFVHMASAGSVGAMVSHTIPAYGNLVKKAGKLAILGGDPIRKNKPWPAWPLCNEQIVDSVVKTTRSRIWCRIQSSSGTVPTFETEFSRLTGAKHCVLTGSGTQALHTAVEALGIGAGDEVITSPYTDAGTIASILSARALPVLADLDRASYQLDPDDVERRITKNTKAIMPVHMMGQPCHMERIMAIAKAHGLKVIEDACQAHLAEYQGKQLGTIGDLGCFSFQSSKTIACGEGGAVIGNNTEAFRAVPGMLRSDQLLVDLVGLPGGAATTEGAYEGICW